MGANSLIGTRLREYEITEEIGKGGMGTVYKARHVYLHKERAMHTRAWRSFPVKRIYSVPGTRELSKWKNELTDRQIGVVEHICGPLMRESGYTHEAAVWVSFAES